MDAQKRYLANKAPELWAAINNKNLWLVRSTEIYNPMTMGQLAKFSREQYVKMPDILDRKAIFEIPQRALFNQCINLLVLPFTGTDIWDCRKYVFVAPMSEFVGELVGGTHQDFLTVGSHVYTTESYLLVPNDEVEKVHADFPNLKSTIVGYNYPKRLSGKETLSCTMELSRGESNIKEETPRLAVENLFDRISREKGIDIWRFPEQYQNSKLRAPKQHPTNLGNNEWAVRVDKHGAQINVDSLLIKFNPLFKADGFSLEVICNKISSIKNALRKKNVTTNDGLFLSDIVETQPDCNDLPGRATGWYSIYVMVIASQLKDFKESQLDEIDKYSESAREYLIAIYSKSFNIIFYLEILHAYKKNHPENVEYINSYLFGIDKPNNKLADILLLLVNKAEHQPLRRLFIRMSNHIFQNCTIMIEETFVDDVFLQLRKQFKRKIDSAVSQLHGSIEYIKQRNENLSDPEARRIHNQKLIKAMAKIKGGKTHRKKINKRSRTRKAKRFTH